MSNSELEVAPQPVNVDTARADSTTTTVSTTTHDSDSSSNNTQSNDSSQGRVARRPKRPAPASRKSSGTIIVPRDYAPNNDASAEEYPPDDARAMSPRRSSEETEAMEEASRASLRENAREAQLNLLEIAESIELVRASHGQLQRQNEMLQDYIGGLTRSMSKSQSQGKGAKGKKK